MRALVTTGPAVDPAVISAPDNVTVTRWVRHTNVLPHCSAVITHGGHGTVMKALIAAGTLAHMLASSTRRRRRDLAILKTLGFTRRQVRHTVAWQATTVVAIALLIGLPAGIAGGRWAWRVFAAQLGVLPEPAIPLTTIVIAIPAALVVANLIAAAPARAAARTQSATVLRTE